MAVIQVAAGIILRGPYILISRRFPEAHLGGLWEFPGGTLEAGETLEECLVREIREELNLSVRVGRKAHRAHQVHPEREIDLHFYFCTPEAGTPEAIGCQEFRWVQAHELEQFEFPDSNRPVLEQLKAPRS